ncbi:MAG: hypothetical protein JWM80_2447 [Cyanobacteria bacterium RYN_339]|nr:hypothetical protein [Cyanobacteria bacterium RYN_339]
MQAPTGFDGFDGFPFFGPGRAGYRPTRPAVKKEPREHLYKLVNRRQTERSGRSGLV